MPRRHRRLKIEPEPLDGSVLLVVEVVCELHAEPDPSCWLCALAGDVPTIHQLRSQRDHSGLFTRGQKVNEAPVPGDPVPDHRREMTSPWQLPE